MDSIRDQYKKFGVKNFYIFHSGKYENPHEPYIRKNILHVYKNWNLNLSNVLDLSCGRGEVTKTLQNLGLNNIEATDPYLSEEYEKNTGKKCMRMSFDDIIKGSLKNKFYSIIICSYALHLLERSKLPLFLYALVGSTDNLLILSPHKNPIIKENWGWNLKNEIVIDRVRTRYFENSMRFYL